VITGALDDKARAPSVVESQDTGRAGDLAQCIAQEPVLRRQKCRCDTPGRALDRGSHGPATTMPLEEL
jgi:hypothetical protein